MTHAPGEPAEARPGRHLDLGFQTSGPKGTQSCSLESPVCGTCVGNCKPQPPPCSWVGSKRANLRKAPGPAATARVPEPPQEQRRKGGPHRGPPVGSHPGSLIASWAARPPGVSERGSLHSGCGVSGSCVRSPAHLLCSLGQVLNLSGPVAFSVRWAPRSGGGAPPPPWGCRADRAERGKGVTRSEPPRRRLIRPGRRAALWGRKIREGGPGFCLQS